MRQRFFSLSDYSFYYRGGRLWTEIREDMQICGLPCFEYPNPYHYPAFSRNVRLQTRLSQEEIEVLDPPARAEKPRANLLMRLLPSVGMLAASAVMAAMGGAMVIFSAVTGGISIVTAVLGVVQSKRDFRKSSRERVEKYESYIERKRREIEECRENERRNLEQIYPSMEEEKRRLTAFSPELFDRSPESEDFWMSALAPEASAPCVGSSIRSRSGWRWRTTCSSFPRRWPRSMPMCITPPLFAR